MAMNFFKARIMGAIEQTAQNAGKSFGEIALMSKDAVRNASIVADDGTDLLVVSRLLFNRSLKSKQEAEYKERKEFIASSSLFNKWIPKFARLLEMSLRKEVFPYGCNIVKQGDPVIGLHFIIKGQAKIIVDPTSHKTQFPKLMQEIERSEVDDIRSRSTKRDNNEKDRHDLLLRHIRVRRREGYAAAEKNVNRTIDLCFVEEQEVIGDIETVLALPTYMHTIQCTAKTEVLILDMKNYERLITRKNPLTIELMKEKVKEKLENRSTTPQGIQVPLVGHIVRKLKPRQKVKAERGLKSQARKREVAMKQLVKLFLENKAPMIEPCVPNTVFYKTKAHERAEVKKNVDRRQGRSNAQANTLSRLYGMNNKRPRSRRELENLASAYPTTFAPPPDPYRRQSAIYVDEDQELDELLSRDNIRTGVQGDDMFKVTQVDGSDEESEQISKGSLINIVSEMDSYQRVTSANRSKVISAVAQRENKHPQLDLLRPKSAPQMKYEDEEVNEEAEHEEVLSQVSEDSNEGDENFDQETSDVGLRTLEDKIRRFVEEPAASAKRVGHGASIRAMKRFEIKTQADIPVPGGTVFVRRKECRFGATNAVGEHQHVRHFMLPKNAFQAIQIEKERMRHKDQREERMVRTPVPQRPRTARSQTRTTPTNRQIRPHSAFVSRRPGAIA